MSNPGPAPNGRTHRVQRLRRERPAAATCIVWKRGAEPRSLLEFSPVVINTSGCRDLCAWRDQMPPAPQTNRPLVRRRRNWTSLWPLQRPPKW